METNKLFGIEVAYAKPEQQVILKLEVPAGCTLEAAIQQSGMLERFPEIDLSQQLVGVFSRVRRLDSAVQAGERIEIYRALQRDPKEARRLRARKGDRRSP